MIIKRHILKAIEKVADTFAVVVISGARQIGKSTLLIHNKPQADYVTFDRIDSLETAIASPERFLESLTYPAVIDEVQYCPSLFRYIKIEVDTHKPQKGSLYLTGSQRFQMMHNVDESLAGRAGIIEMAGLSLREILGDSFDEPFIPTASYIKTRKPKTLKDTIWDVMYRGDLPELTVDLKMEPSIYYRSYVETYLQRDVSDLAQVGDLSKFNRFLQLTAFTHGTILNKTKLASECDISFVTLERWLGILESSNIIYLLKPFTANNRKRLVKSPKLYFLNAGLAASLCGFTSAAELETSTMAGAFFEGFVITEVAKSFLNATGRMPRLYFYRDSNGKEIDLIIEDRKTLYPIEIKKAEIAHTSDVKAFTELDAISSYTRGPGAVICTMGLVNPQSAKPLPLPNDSWALPVTYI